MTDTSTVPKTLAAALEEWPERKYTPSPPDWRDEVFYFLLPDRFSNGQETPDRLLSADLSTAAGLAAIQELRGSSWRWDKWKASGSSRFQGGTLAGIKSKLDYLHGFGVTTLWIAPIFRQRVEIDTYHGYGIQNFLDIDPRFGTSDDLVELVSMAHQLYGMKVVLDVIFNHSGCNWLYDESTGNAFQPPYKSNGAYEPIWPRNGFGGAIYDSGQTLKQDDYVWPREFQDYHNYVRAGSGDLGKGDINDSNAEHKRTDFCDLRKFNLSRHDTLNALSLSFQYWIALADVDGFRIDTFKHVTQDQARNFCNAIKEYAEVLGKRDFFLVAEVAGGNAAQDRYLDVTGRNLNACLDIGEQREAICDVSRGLSAPSRFFKGFSFYDLGMGSHRNYGSRHLSISNDHDHVFGAKLRLSVDASNDHQGAAAAAIQLFTLGIPCIYYGMEQGLASGVEPGERKYLGGDWGKHDCLLREAMFGPEHPLASGFAGTTGAIDTDMVGFGPHGTAGYHVFNDKHPIYTRIKQMTDVRALYRPLTRGRQYPRGIKRCFDADFFDPAPGELMAWSRIFDDQEILVVLNPHGTEGRGAKIIVDAYLSGGDMTVLLNTDPLAPKAWQPGAKRGTEKVNGCTCVAVEDWLLGPSEVLILANDSGAAERLKRQ